MKNIKNVSHHPDSYAKEVVNHLNSDMTVSYVRMHEKIGQFPFDFRDYINNFDWYNPPPECAYVSSIQNKQAACFAGQSVQVKAELLNDEFGQAVRDYCENVIGYKIYMANIIMQPPGSTSPLHKDMHGAIRFKYGLKDIIPQDRVMDYFSRYWIPLSDRQFGQWFDLNGVIINSWKAGEVYRLFGVSRYPHCGGNLGFDNRLLMMLTGCNLTVDEIKSHFT